MPRYYAPYDVSSFILAPVPDAAYAVELNYFYRPVSITASTDGTTWLGTNAPNALLYACLVESYIFMKGEQPIISLYEARYAESIARLKNYGEGLENTDTYREGLVRTIKS